MRDYALALALLVLLPQCLRRPWVGIMTWAWVSLMSPHLQTYGFMNAQPVSMIVGGATLVGLVFTKDPRRLPMSPPVAMLVLFSFWMVVTWPFSIVPTDENLDQLTKVLKINLMTLVAILVLHTRRQVDILIMVVVLSLGWFGVKGGIFTMLTGGAFHVRGEGGFVSGNNEIGLALIMTIPLIWYLVLTSTKRWMRWALLAMACLNVVAVIGTQSRGALLGIMAMVIAFVVRSPNRGRLVLPIVALTCFVLVFMPDSYWDRMATIGEYHTDDSALGRLNAWRLAFNVAADNFFGGGFVLETQGVFARYAPNPDFIAVAHSVYFQVLGQHGFIGLAIYLASGSRCSPPAGGWRAMPPTRATWRSRA